MQGASILQEHPAHSLERCESVSGHSSTAHEVALLLLLLLQKKKKKRLPVLRQLVVITACILLVRFAL